ncbi:MAG TPA: hypothetical protein VMJ52_20120 [Xanthobacteraceae bacterium]|nr:hypothetical protein [Xanthobacteraceae bacterium]
MAPLEQALGDEVEEAQQRQSDAVGAGGDAHQREAMLYQACLMR